MARPTKKREMVKVSATTNLNQLFLEAVDRLALELNQSRSELMEALLMRGFAAYRRDGRLHEPFPEKAPGEAQWAWQDRFTGRLVTKEQMEWRRVAHVLGEEWQEKLARLNPSLAPDTLKPEEREMVAVPEVRNGEVERKKVKARK
jgi:hypothetical protein